MAMNAPIFIPGWWVGEEGEARRREKGCRGARSSMVDVTGKDSKKNGFRGGREREARSVNGFFGRPKTSAIEQGESERG